MSYMQADLHIKLMQENIGNKIYVNIPHAGRYQLETLLKEVNELREAN